MPITDANLISILKIKDELAIKVMPITDANLISILKNKSRCPAR